MLSNNRVLIASIALLIAAFVAYLAYDSPNRFGAAVLAAARNHDTLRLQQLIDFPAVGDGLKSDLKPIMAQALNQQLASANAAVSGPVAAKVAVLAQGMVDTAVDQMVDQLVTPAALEQLIDDKPVQVSALGRQTAPLDEIFPKDRSGARFRVSRKYLAFSRFRFTLANAAGRSSVDIDLVRHGLVGWRVERVSPNISLADIGAGDAAVPTAAGEPPPPPPPPSGEAVASAAAAAQPPAEAAGLPTQIGQCVTTTVKQVSTRLEDTPGSGSEVTFANGGRQVSYDQVPDVDASQPGDGVKMCLVSLPQDCPPGDDRGRQYKTTNLRTGGAWTLPDSEHMCGGA
jgi:hypothetical protein